MEVFYVLNYTKKNSNLISLGITIIVSIFLFILLDICFLKVAEVNNGGNIYWNVEEVSRIKRKDPPGDAMELQNIFLEMMQIADIYDENTLIEEIENSSEASNQKEENNSEEVVQQESNTKMTEAISTNTSWRIEIPKINLKAPIQSGTTQDILRKAVGHFKETNSWTGNVALAGHNRGYQCNFFQNIKKLEIGDKIIYYTEQGKREYQVVLNKIIKQTDWSYIQNTEDNRITLITCVENMYEYRRCVQAVEIT